MFTCSLIKYMNWKSHYIIWRGHGVMLDTLYQLNSLRPRQNERHFADDTFKRIFVNENVRILIEISVKFVPNGPINNIPALVQIMAWRRPGDKPLSEPMLVCLPTHICVTRPQWVKRGLYQWHIPHAFIDVDVCTYTPFLHMQLSWSTTIKKFH